MNHYDGRRAAQGLLPFGRLVQEAFERYQEAGEGGLEVAFKLLQSTEEGTSKRPAPPPLRLLSDGLGVATSRKPSEADLELQEEQRRFWRALPELLVEHPGAWVCWKDGRVQWHGDNPDSALAYGRRTFSAGFLVVQVAPRDPPDGAWTWSTRRRRFTEPELPRAAWTREPVFDALTNGETAVFGKAVST